MIHPDHADSCTLVNRHRAKTVLLSLVELHVCKINRQTVTLEDDAETFETLTATRNPNAASAASS